MTSDGSAHRDRRPGRLQVDDAPTRPQVAVGVDDADRDATPVLVGSVLEREPLPRLIYHRAQRILPPHDRRDALEPHRARASIERADDTLDGSRLGVGEEVGAVRILVEDEVRELHGLVVRVVQRETQRQRRLGEENE